jgi:hypothetical protein
MKKKISRFALGMTTQAFVISNPSAYSGNFVGIFLN